MDVKYILIFLLVIPFVSSSVRINEVELNPSGNDYPNEWIELYSYDFINVTNWRITSNNGRSMILNATFSGYYILNTTYNLLTNDNQQLSLLDFDNNTINITILMSDTSDDEKTWSYCDEEWIFTNSTKSYENDCPNLKNCDWKIEILLDKYIFNLNEEINWIVKISRNYGEKANVSVRGYIKDLLSDWKTDYNPWTNESITSYRNKDYNPNLWENKFYEIFFNITELNCNDTNFQNNFYNKFIMILPVQEYTTQDYSAIEINEFLPNPVGNDDAAMPSGEWIELYNSGSTALDLENLSLKDNYGQDRDIFISDSNTIGGTTINSRGYLVVYMNGRYGFLNNEDYEKIYLYNDNYLLDEVSYSGSTEGLSWNKVDNKWVSTLPTPGAQNHGNETGNIINSNLKIEDIYDLGNDNKAKFGQTIRVKLSVYKGNTNKESISVSIENEKGEGISKESRANVGDKYTNYSLTLPVQIIANCKQKFKDGEYFIVTSGLDDTDKEEIEVSGIDSSLCEIIKEYSQKDISKTYSNGSESVLNKELITGNVIYESKSEKQGRYSTYFFCFALIMLIIYLLWKNE